MNLFIFKLETIAKLDVLNQNFFLVKNFPKCIGAYHININNLTKGTNLLY